MKAIKIIAACGNDCAACPRYNAHPYEKTETELRHTAELWMKIGYRDRIVSNEEIACSGCSSHKQCTYQLIECTKEHGVSKCSQCARFPCQKIQDMLTRSAAYQKRCAEVCSETEFRLLEKAFFDKENLLMR